MFSALSELFQSLLPGAPRPVRRRTRAPVWRAAPEPSTQLGLELELPDGTREGSAGHATSLAPAPVPPAARSATNHAAPAPRARSAALPRRDAMYLLERLRALGLPANSELSLTRNRTIMVSWRGARLRVHEGFANADETVLRAIVQFVAARRPADRTAAVRLLRSHPLPDVAARVPRRLGTVPEDQPIAERLTLLHRSLNARWFGGTLARIEVVVSRRMKSRLGHYALQRDGVPGQIAVSRRHLRRHGWTQAAETLLHEMVHQWQDETGRRVDHGRVFRTKAREVGITPAARRAV